MGLLRDLWTVGGRVEARETVIGRVGASSSQPGIREVFPLALYLFAGDNTVFAGTVDIIHPGRQEKEGQRVQSCPSVPQVACIL